ncbi:Uncharacterised protein [Segatella copri]|nr:Uncharacterised protein [Segatella copri]
MVLTEIQYLILETCKIKIRQRDADISHRRS